MAWVVSEEGATWFCKVQDTVYLWKANSRSLILWKRKLELISRNTIPFGRGSLKLQRHPKPHFRDQLLCVAFSAL